MFTHFVNKMIWSTVSKAFRKSTNVQTLNEISNSNGLSERSD